MQDAQAAFQSGLAEQATGSDQLVDDRPGGGQIASHHAAVEFAHLLFEFRPEQWPQVGGVRGHASGPRRMRAGRLDCIEKAAPVDRLQQEAIRFGSTNLAAGLVWRGCAGHDNPRGWVPLRPGSPDSANCLESIGIRQFDVHQNYLWQPGHREPQGFLR